MYQSLCLICSTIISVLSLSATFVHSSKQNMTSHNDVCTSLMAEIFNTTYARSCQVSTIYSSELTNVELSLILTSSMDSHQNATSSKEIKSTYSAECHVQETCTYDCAILVVELTCFREVLHVQMKVQCFIIFLLNESSNMYNNIWFLNIN